MTGVFVGSPAAFAGRLVGGDGVAVRVQRNVLSPGFPAYVGLVHLDQYAERLRYVGVSHRHSDALEHPPRGLVGNAYLPLELAPGYSLLAVQEEVDGVEPLDQARGRFLEDGTGEGGEGVVADFTVAGPGPLPVAVDLYLRAAVGAGKGIAVPDAQEVIDSGFFSRKQLVKFLKGHSVNLLHIM
jgi:hypothetical protein